MTVRALRQPFAMLRAVGSRVGLDRAWQAIAPSRPPLPGAPRPMNKRRLRLRDLPAAFDAADSVMLETLAPRPGDALVELTIRLEASRAELGRYLYSKLYWSTRWDEPFSEDRVACFEVAERGRDERLQVALPGAAWQAARANGHLRLRIDGLPYSQGRWQLLAVRLVDGSADPPLAARARRLAQKQWVREQVRVSERGHRSDLPHYPESVSLELTPVCNLRCPHCSSHGMPHLHKHHNRQPEMPLARLRAIAEETFPHVSTCSIVGRGEPTLVSDALWAELFAQLRRHDVRLSCVTNGTRVRQRFDAASLPSVHELIFSMDGLRPATFEANRAGAKFESVVDNLRYYHELRSRVPQSRRSQLTISWTLKRNNVAELPDFARWIAQFEPDLISLRHLVVFQDKERPESLLEHTAEANEALAECYFELDRLGIRHESPPLMLDAPDAVQFTATDGGLPPVPPPRPERAVIPIAVAEREPECNWMHRTAIIMADGEVITCGKHYGEQVGHLDERTSVWDIWNGPRMQSLRDGFGRPHMWDQCRDCWLRELKWHSQREAKDLSRPYSLAEGMDYTRAAWDYRRYSEL
jgi:radical SAM protein with 4Fe4S-binding SPASM domain